MKGGRKITRFLAGSGFVLLIIGAGLALYHQYGPLEERPLERYNLIIFSVDALRPDHLGCYGYRRNTSPEIDRLARKSALFERAYAQSTWTFPSSFSILTSLYPSAHGLTLTSLPPRKTLEYVLRWNLFSVMEEAGYSIRGLLNSWFGAGNLDKIYKQVEKASGPAGTMSRKAKWFIRKNRRRPFFLLLHYMEVHSPYFPRKGYIEKFAKTPPPPYLETFVREVNTGRRKITPAELSQIIDIYDSNILLIDEKLRELRSLLESLGISDRTIIVVTADHGEAFMEHGYLSHSLKLYEEFIRIPFIVFVPGITEQGRRISAPVQSIDLLPTVVDLLNLPRPPKMQGVSLVPFLKGQSPASLMNRDVFCEVTFDTFYYHPGLVKANEGKDPGPECQYMAAVISGPWKLITYLKTGRKELFNLERDPQEKENLWTREPQIGRSLEKKLEDYWKRNLAAGGVDLKKEANLSKQQIFQRIFKSLIPMSKKVVDQLKALGYLK